jgi:uncharacterized protein
MRFKVYRSGLIRRGWRWRLFANNNRILADSGEAYQSKGDCLNAIQLIRDEAANAPVEIVERV